MATQKKNYYGSLCSEMYEILHETAPKDELDFYLSYAKKGQAILEPLCGSGRFLVPFLERGFDICGLDNSEEMIEKLKQKAPSATVMHSEIETFHTAECFDYIFITSGSMSLFTDIESCKNILRKMKSLLTETGQFVFAVDTVKTRCPDDSDYRVCVSVMTKDQRSLVLKTKNYYDTRSHTQFSPGIYELYQGAKLCQSEKMDFQIHLYEPGEMEAMLTEAGFTKIKVYSSFEKDTANLNHTDMFLYECSVSET